MPWLDRIFSGRKLALLGYNRQRIPGNWKLMMENIKDPYHPGLLHTWFVTFGLWRADQKSRMVMDAHGRHAVMISRRNEGGENKAVTQGVTRSRRTWRSTTRACSTWCRSRGGRSPTRRTRARRSCRPSR